jgi:hypothetical protein
MWRRVGRYKVADDSEEYAASIFRAEDEAKQSTSKK